MTARKVAAMTEPITVTVLDEQTQNELQPPCDVYRFTDGPNPPCSNPADLIVRVARCGQHKDMATAYLICEPHRDLLIAQSRWSCCKATSFESLR